MGKKKSEVPSGSNVDQNVQDFELLDDEEKSRILSFTWFILLGQNIDTLGGFRRTRQDS